MFITFITHSLFLGKGVNILILLGKIIQNKYMINLRNSIVSYAKRDCYIYLDLLLALGYQIKSPLIKMKLVNH